eukprot:582812_1
MHSIQQPIINQTMFGPLLQPRDRYQRIWDEFIKRNLEVIAMHDWQLRDVAIRDTIREIYPAYNAAFYDGLASIRECISKYHGPTTYRTVLNSIHIDCETDRKNIKAAEKVAKNWWHQQWRVWDELFTHHITHLRTFDDPNDPHTLIRRDQVIHLLLNTTIKLAPQAKEQPLLKSSTLLKGVALHDTLETFRPGLNLKALRKRLAEIKKPSKKRVGGREFATSLREQLNQNEHSVGNTHAPISNLLLERSNQNRVPVQSDETHNSLNGQHNAPLENANNAYETPPVALLEWNVDDQIMQRGIGVETQAIPRNNHTNLRDDSSSSDESHHPMVVQPSLQEHNAPFQPGPLPAAPAPVPFDFYRNSTWDNTAHYHPMQYNEHINYYAPPPIQSIHHPIAMRYGDYNAPQVGDMRRRSNHAWSPYANTNVYQYPQGYGNVHGGNHMGFVQQHRYSPYGLPSPVV